jgi:hypothetical protein
MGRSGEAECGERKFIGQDKAEYVVRLTKFNGPSAYASMVKKQCSSPNKLLNGLR